MLLIRSGNMVTQFFFPQCIQSLAPLLDRMDCIAVWDTGLERKENYQMIKPCIGMQLTLEANIYLILVNYDYKGTMII